MYSFSAHGAGASSFGLTFAELHALPADVGHVVCVRSANVVRAFLAYKHDGDDCNQDEAAADNADNDTSAAAAAAVAAATAAAAGACGRASWQHADFLLNALRRGIPEARRGGLIKDCKH